MFFPPKMIFIVVVVAFPLMIVERICCPNYDGFNFPFFFVGLGIVFILNEIGFKKTMRLCSSLVSVICFLLLILCLLGMYWEYTGT